ncbi:hypothetical protein DY000_02011809 [Brassica cretica]|uniref:Gamma carbonic anhydrase family protein n=1 Tax=Brassica cretica TaxID=69181 RepID=A0ABQ7D962_BRACR|nr:hypothetical protein DY000_02011809 [Brassica cretica]
MRGNPRGLLHHFIGDANSISVGAGTNIHDNYLVHVAEFNLSGNGLPTVIGDNVTVGHSAVLHGCTVEDKAYIGASANQGRLIGDKRCDRPGPKPVSHV